MGVLAVIEGLGTRLNHTQVQLLSQSRKSVRDLCVPGLGLVKA